jgi:outer membrane lipopolysaccharide assembly protein LptE/RlpB
MGTEKHKKISIQLCFSFYFLFLISYFLFVSSCGYHIVGSKPLPFDSITIKPINNKTYEPRLEDRLHSALSKEFIAQGIKVMAINGDVDLEATITTFKLGSIAAIEEKAQEQEITMRVNVRLIDKNRVTEFVSMESPIRITFQSTGAVSESVVQKERAIDKAFSEIAREIISKIIIRYAK